MIANLSLFSGRLFSAGPEQAELQSPDVSSVEIQKIVIEAEMALRSACRDIGDVLSPSAWEDLRTSVSRFIKHAVLLNPGDGQLQSFVCTWVEVQQEMLSRLHSDQDALGAWLFADCGRVTTVELDLSDRHDGGRTVAVLTFQSGVQVVYKPREMRIEDWYSRFAGWLNESGSPFRVCAASVMTRPGYGWMKFVPHTHCVSQEELRGYYRNAGALLCMLHVLRARDCHFQNLIACGEQPVLVDAEMLFQAQITEHAPSVSHTGMIPNFRFGPEGQHYDVSGLGFVKPKSTHFCVPEWCPTGVRYAMGMLEPRENVPFMEDEALRPQDYISEMVEGFTQTYRFLAGHSIGVLGWIRTAAALPVRYLLRETMQYYEALQFDLSQEGEEVIRLPALAPAYTVFTSLRQQEIDALKRLDIPRFLLAAGERSLCGVDGCFYRSGLENAQAAIEELSEKDLAKQIQHIRLSWSLSRVSTTLT